MEKTPQECPFCEPKQRILVQNDVAYLMLSNPRKVEGHTLVIPHRHVERPWELSTEELAGIFKLVNLAQERLLAAFATGVDTRQHYRPFLPESKFKVNHVHFHVMPRTFEDTLYANADVHEGKLFADLLPDEHDRVASLFS